MVRAEVTAVTSDPKRGRLSPEAPLVTVHSGVSSIEHLTVVVATTDALGITHECM